MSLRDGRALVSMSTAVVCALAAVAGALFAAAVARADSYVYVAGTSATDGAVFQYGLDSGGTLAALGEPSAPTGQSPIDIAVHPTGAYVYVTNCNGVSQYDAESGLLLEKTQPLVPAGAQPDGLDVSRDGKLLYVANSGGAGACGAGPGTISQYKIDPGSGALSANASFVPAPAPGMTDAPMPSDVAVHPNGKSVYMTNVGMGIHGSNLVYQFDVGADGTLSYKSPAATVAAGDFASSVVVSADGKSAYVVSAASATISQYDVDATSGALTPKADSSVGAGLQPNQIALSLDGGSAYVTDFGDPITGGGSVWQYNVSTASGTLSRKVPPRVSFAGMTNPWGVAVSGNGEWVYVADSGRRSQPNGTLYQIGVDSRGFLSSTPSATLPAGVSPTGVAVNPPPKPATPGPDLLVGSIGDDFICGRGGSDKLSGLRGDDQLYGDRCDAPASAAGIRGSAGRDRLRGGAGKDQLYGGAGKDRLHGGAGRDRLHGGAGRDLLRGGPGRDILRVRGGGRDHVHCGAARDRVRADQRDVLRRCEQIIRR